MWNIVKEICLQSSQISHHWLNPFMLIKHTQLIFPLKNLFLKKCVLILCSSPLRAAGKTRTEWLFHISTFLSSLDASGATSDVEQNPHGAIICLWLAAKCSETPSFASRAPHHHLFMLLPGTTTKWHWTLHKVFKSWRVVVVWGRGGGNQSIPSNTNSEWKTHKQEQDLHWTHPCYYE